MSKIVALALLVATLATTGAVQIHQRQQMAMEIGAGVQTETGTETKARAKGFMNWVFQVEGCMYDCGWLNVCAYKHCNECEYGSKATGIWFADAECAPPSAALLTALQAGYSSVADHEAAKKAVKEAAERAAAAEEEAAAQAARAKAVEEAAAADAAAAAQALKDAADEEARKAAEIKEAAAAAALEEAKKAEEEAQAKEDAAKLEEESAKNSETEFEISDEQASIGFCPNFEVKRATDDGVDTWMDEDNEVYAQMPTGIKSDNAGTFSSDGEAWAMHASISPSREDIAGKVYKLGNNVFIVSSVDDYGNINQCHMNVLVVDEEPPRIECPADMTLETDSGVCFTKTEWADPAPLDNVNGVTASSSHVTPSNFVPGVAIVVFTAEDIAGNTANCSFKVTIEDKEIPSLICPASRYREFPTPICAGDPVIEVPCTVSDNCGAVTPENVVSVPKVPMGFPLGEATVKHSLEDRFGNKNEAETIVTVKDVTAPIITCPDNIEEPLPAGEDTTMTVDLTDATAEDNSCTVETTCMTSNPGQDLKPGTHTVAWEAKDAAGNSADCSFTIKISDETAPVWANCPGDEGDLRANTIKGEDYQIMKWTMPTATDNNGAQGITFGGDFETLVTDLAYPLGMTHIKYTAADEAGNEAICEFDVLVHDAEKPRFVRGNLADKKCAEGEAGVATGDVCFGPKITVGSHDSSTRANSEVSVENFTQEKPCCTAGDTCKAITGSSAFKICNA